MSPPFSRLLGFIGGDRKENRKQVNLNEGEGRKIASLQERLGGLESVKFGEGVFLAINKNIMDILDGFVDPLSLIG